MMVVPRKFYFTVKLMAFNAILDHLFSLPFRSPLDRLPLSTLDTSDTRCTLDTACRAMSILVWQNGQFICFMPNLFLFSSHTRTHATNATYKFLSILIYFRFTASTVYACESNCVKNDSRRKKEKKKSNENHQSSTFRALLIVVSRKI